MLNRASLRGAMDIDFCKCQNCDIGIEYFTTFTVVNPQLLIAKQIINYYLYHSRIFITLITLEYSTG